jgi:hypothetical protein
LNGMVTMGGDSRPILTYYNTSWVD